MFLASVADRDAVVNQLCSVIVPPVLLYMVLMHFFGAKYANYLLNKDTYTEKRIKVRRFAVLRIVGICSALFSLIAYFSMYKAWDMVIFFAALLLGYTWIKFRTYSAHLEYTYRYLIFRTGKKREVFPWKEVAQVSWRTSRGSIAYSLQIQFHSGLKAYLSSSDFVGLTKLKAFFDEKHYKD